MPVPKNLLLRDERKHEVRGPDEGEGRISLGRWLLRGGGGGQDQGEVAAGGIMACSVNGNDDHKQASGQEPGGGARGRGGKGRGGFKGVKESSGMSHCLSPITPLP